MLIDHYNYWLEQTAQGEFCAHFPDLPALTVRAPSIERLLPGLHDALTGYLEEFMKNGNPAPEPAPRRLGEETLRLKPTTVAKLRLAAIVREQNISAAELARRLDCLPQEAARILKLTHPTKIDTMAAALAALGVELRVCAD